MPFTLGCKFTVEYFITGFLGGVVAILILPGSCMTMPRIERKNGAWTITWGDIAKLIVAGIAGCVVDCNPRNAFFGGFFSWHAFRWLSEEGFQMIKSIIVKEQTK